MLFHHITVLFCSYCLSKDVGLNTDAVLYQTSPNSRHSNSQSKSLAFPLHHSVRDGSHGHSLSSSHHSQRSSSSSKNSGETEASAYIQSRLVLNSDFSVVINNRNMRHRNIYHNICELKKKTLTVAGYTFITIY